MRKQVGLFILTLVLGFVGYRVDKNFRMSSVEKPAVALAVDQKENIKQKSPPSMASEVPAPRAAIPKIESSGRAAVKVEPPLAGEVSVEDQAVKYVLDEGLAVINGDIVIGVPTKSETNESGYVAPPVIQVWTRREIPYFIQPSVKNPARVEQALALFSSTAIRFVPYTDQKDVLVFEDSVGVCKSYVGKIGGKQPVWIPPGCEASEIAHELMHALGFIHEQNRTDRDISIDVLNENIEPQFLDNFVILPESMMRLTGLAPFDFESLMVYPVSMFAKPGQSTMRVKDTRNQIQPSQTLSVRDVERINAAFGDLPPQAVE